jgi:quinol monooxygenase YgiN
MRLAGLFGVGLLLAASTAYAAHHAPPPIVAVIHVDIVPDDSARGSALLRGYAADSRHDPGNIRVDVLQQVGRPNHFTVVEEWTNESTYDAHLGAPHTRQFRAAVQPMLGSPFDERLHTIIR